MKTMTNTSANQGLERDGRPKPQRTRRGLSKGFSLVEVLLAIFILGIGLAMVAAIFPVGAEWTRQSSEETVGAVIANNAVAIIQAKMTAADLSSTSLQGLSATGFAKLPIAERAYDFGRRTPYPSANPANAMYFWTALTRLSPGSTNRFDVYILVFKKGAVEQTFTTSSEVPNTRDLTNDPLDASGKLLVPMVVSGAISANDFIVGTQGIGVTSGTVFRKKPGNVGNPPLAGTENVIYVPAADNTVASPLIYIYQTTLSF